MELIHILPKKNLSRNLKQKYELYLVDDILKDSATYREQVRGKKSYKILDNSLNELGSSYHMDCISDAAEIIKPNEFVLPDDMDPDISRAMLVDSLNRVKEYKNLKHLKKMAVVHANENDFYGYLREMERLADNKKVDVIGIPKVVANMFNDKKWNKGRVVLTSLYLSRGNKKPVHFLGFVGFDEFKHYEYLTHFIRTMDSRVMLSADCEELYKRSDILSQKDLQNDTVEDVEYEMRRVKEVYKAYGLR